MRKLPVVKETVSVYEIHYDIHNNSDCVSKTLLVQASSFGEAEAKFLKAKPTVRNNTVEIVSIEKSQLEVL